MVQEELISKIQASINKSHQKPALIPFIVSGYPDFETTKNLLKLFEEKKVAAIELGIPFSDPLADGPVIQKASKTSLENGTNIDKIFAMLEEIKVDFSTPIILFTYYNPVLSYGAEEFIKKAASLKVSGLIIPDLPLEESENVSKTCKENNIDLIMLVSPTSDMERIEKISKASSGFIYLVSSTGVTGVRESFSEQLGNILQEIKTFTKTPVAVGFGISKAEHIKELQDLNADAAIIGSAIIKLIDQYKDDKALLLDKMAEYLDGLY
jgi:tryptophan synthase alpha chain